MDEQRAVPYGHNSTSVLRMQAAVDSSLNSYRSTYLFRVGEARSASATPTPSQPSALYRTGSSPTEGRRDQKSDDAVVVMPSGARAWCHGAETCSGALRFPLTTLLDFSASLEMTIDGSWRAFEWLLGDEATVDGQGLTGKECIDRIREHCTVIVHWRKSPSRPSPADWGRSQRASFNRTGGGQAKFSYQGKRCATASQ